MPAFRNDAFTIDAFRVESTGPVNNTRKLIVELKSNNSISKSVKSFLQINQGVKS